MNKQQLIKIAKRQIDEKRFCAEERCNATLLKLRLNHNYESCERNLRIAQISGDKAKINECKTRIHELLKELGVDEKSLRPQYSCELCNDTGYINKQMCSCLKNEFNRLLTEQSNVINDIFTFDNSTETNKHNALVYKKAKEIIQNGEKNLLLTGNTGTGKTYLVTACANLAINCNRSTLFYTAYNLNSLFLDAHLSDYQTKQSILDSLTDADLLIIDDLGTEIAYKNVTAEYLFAVLNERFVAKKQTIICTNLTLPQLRERYDERIFSRLVDTSITIVAQLEGADKRIKK